MKLSVSVATVGRPTLEATLQSVTSQLLPGDEVLVIGATDDIRQRAEAMGCRFLYCPAGNDWGASERNATLPSATGDYIAFLDDDDVWTGGARVAIEAAMQQHAGRPLIFRMQYAEHGLLLWARQEAAMGNVGTPMMVMSNDPAKLGTFGTFYGGDFHFLQTSKWDLQRDLVWVPHIIARIRPH